MQYEAGRYEEKETGQFIYKSPFRFIIPMMLLPYDPTLNKQLLQLPPSLKVGDSITDRTGRMYMQPLISYAIRAVAEFRGCVPEPSPEVQDTREIKLIPFTEIEPPLAIEDFPGEYTSTSTKPLAKTPLGGLFGEMSISMNEPPALRFTDVSPSAGTLGSLRIVLRHVDAPAVNAEPKRLTCTINSGILVKMFSSTMPLRGMPSYSILTTEKQLRLRACCIDLQTRKIDAHSWKREAGHQPGGEGEPQSSIWATTLILPICSPKRLPPTFCNTLAALRYALRVRLDIRGMYHSPFKLEVPLQVVYCREEGNARGDLIADDHYNQQNVRNLCGVSGVLQVGSADDMCSFHSIDASQHPRLETSPPAYDDDWAGTTVVVPNGTNFDN